MANKGSPFERELCRTLTAWWTNDPERDVIFWRTSQSGGRATFRSRKGKRTSQAHCGDITHIEPEGEPLTALITIEAKRGYNKATIQDVIDRPLKGPFGRSPKPQPIEVMLDQTIAACNIKRTPYWMLIHKRDAREPICYISTELLEELVGLGTHFGRPGLVCRFDCIAGEDYELVETSALPFNNFLKAVDPEDIRILARRHKC